MEIKWVLYFFKARSLAAKWILLSTYHHRLKMEKFQLYTGSLAWPVLNKISSQNLEFSVMLLNMALLLLLRTPAQVSIISPCKIILKLLCHWLLITHWVTHNVSSFLGCDIMQPSRGLPLFWRKISSTEDYSPHIHYSEDLRSHSVHLTHILCYNKGS